MDWEHVCEFLVGELCATVQVRDPEGRELLRMRTGKPEGETLLLTSQPGKAAQEVEIRLNRALLASSRTAHLLESVLDGVLEVSLEGRILRAGGDFQQLRPHAAKGSLWIECFDPRDGASLLAAQDRMRSDGTAETQARVGDKTFWLKLLNDKDRFVCAARDISDTADLERALDVNVQQLHALQIELATRSEELEIANRQLTVLARTDGLTGLVNYRAFQDALTQEVSRAHRFGLPLSLLMVDIDHFKAFNDRFGHPAGDELLKHFAGLLLRSSREVDIVARYGGEEFALLLVGTNKAGALERAERLRESVQIEEFAHAAIGCSIGAATLTLDESPAALLRNADLALYQSKRSGRNRVTHFDELGM